MVGHRAKLAGGSAQPPRQRHAPAGRGGGAHFARRGGKVCATIRLQLLPPSLHARIWQLPISACRCCIKYASVFACFCMSAF